MPAVLSPACDTFVLLCRQPTSDAVGSVGAITVMPALLAPACDTFVLLCRQLTSDAVDAITVMPAVLAPACDTLVPCYKQTGGDAVDAVKVMPGVLARAWRSSVLCCKQTGWDWLVLSQACQWCFLKHGVILFCAASRQQKMPSTVSEICEQCSLRLATQCCRP